MKKTSMILLALYATLILALLVLVVAGARLYASAVDARTSHDEQRLALAYIQSQTAGRQEQVSLQEFPFGQALLLQEGEDLETAVYFYDGALYTQLWKTTSALLPEEGDILCSLSGLDLIWETPGLLRITAGEDVGYAWCGGERHGQ